MSSTRAGPSIPPRDQGANTFTSFPRMTIEHVSDHTNILEGSLVQLHVEFSENRGNDQKDLGFGETSGEVGISTPISFQIGGRRS